MPLRPRNNDSFLRSVGRWRAERRKKTIRSRMNIGEDKKLEGSRRDYRLISAFHGTLPPRTSRGRGSLTTFVNKNNRRTVLFSSTDSGVPPLFSSITTRHSIPRLRRAFLSPSDSPQSYSSPQFSLLQFNSSAARRVRLTPG